MELQCQRFRALELPGHHEHLAHAGERAADECLVPETARVLEVLLEQLKRLQFVLSSPVQGPGKLVAGCRHSVSSPTVCQSSVACSSRLSAVADPPRASSIAPK